MAAERKRNFPDPLALPTFLHRQAGGDLGEQLDGVKPERPRHRAELHHVNSALGSLNE